MLYWAYHGAGYHDYTFTEYPEIEAALLTKLDVNGDGSIDTIDVYFIPVSYTHLGFSRFCNFICY